MASKFQNRLVGTLILVALGVILLPSLLDGKKKSYKEQFAAIPLVAKAEDSQQPASVGPATQSLAAQPSKPSTSKKPELKPQTPEEAPIGQAYVVQLGAFKNADKVNEIVAKLRASGHRAYTLPTTPVPGEITRVLVGPEANRQSLEQALPHLKQISGLSGQIRLYNVAH